MKLLFSEYPATYSEYKFPYHIWAWQEPKDETDSLLAQGFLPTRFKINLWYLARSSRVNLDTFEESSENRRILKNTHDFSFEEVEQHAFTLTDEYMGIVRSFLKTVDTEFSDAAIKRLFSSHLCNKIIIWKKDGNVMGLSPILTTDQSYFYWYGFYHPDYQSSGIGMRMMLHAVLLAKEEGKKYVYIGTVYTKGSLYKTNFEGFEFFNGFQWRNSKDELKYLIEKDGKSKGHDLFKDERYMENFYGTRKLQAFIGEVTRK